jgi:O-antigen/teichoic acid export membrane protein
VVIRGFLYGVHEERFSQGLLVFWKGLYTMGALAVAYAGFGVVSIFIVYVVSYVLAVISGLGWGYRLVKSKISSLSFDRGTTRQVGQFGATTLVGFMSALLLYKTDILLIRYFLDDTLVAEYQAALFPAELVWFIPGAIQGALLQNTAGDWAEGRIEKVSDTLKNGVKYGVMSLILCGVGLFMLAEEFLLVYFGPEYATSAPLLQILLVGSIVFGINRVYGPVLQAIGEVKRQQATIVVALVLNIVLNLLFIPRFGILGAAVATTISYSSVILGSHLLIHFSPVRSPPRKVVAKLSVLLVAFAVLYGGVVTVVSLPPVSSLLVFPMLGLLIFGALCHYLRLFSITDARRTLSEL